MNAYNSDLSQIKVSYNSRYVLRYSISSEFPNCYFPNHCGFPFPAGPFYKYYDNNFLTFIITFKITFVILSHLAI